ncbi:Hypothetical protein NGAL_HAMBI2566_36970 [Neorhizobium galegae bv. orientalis]|nr:hypothetical protein F4V90_17775 [Neorhizobium galegae]CDZ59851.1 Hypothetical protein NGAL_HAMBI2566_36970 [Neorhizobium galegae bv. orientalis]
MDAPIFASAQAAPLWPAGHLPHGWGDRLGARSPLSIPRLILRFGSSEATVMPLVISPPVGEMAGRPEGGDLAPAFTFSSKETHNVPRS